jgi:hypothetical protein
VLSLDIRRKITKLLSTLLTPPIHDFPRRLTKQQVDESNARRGQPLFRKIVPWTGGSNLRYSYSYSLFRNARGTLQSTCCEILCGVGRATTHAKPRRRFKEIGLYSFQGMYETRM